MLITGGTSNSCEAEGSQPRTQSGIDSQFGGRTCRRRRLGVLCPLVFHRNVDFGAGRAAERARDEGTGLDNQWEVDACLPAGVKKCERM